MIPDGFLKNIQMIFLNTAWKVSKYGVFSGPYFPVFSPNTGKYEPEKAPFLDTFHAVKYFQTSLANEKGYH